MHPCIEVEIVNLNPEEIQDKILIAMATGVVETLFAEHRIDVSYKTVRRRAL